MLTKQEYMKLPPQEKERYVRQILRKIVEDNQNGVIVSQLSKKLPFSSRTIEKHLSILTYTNEIYTVKIGPTILYLPNSKAMHHVLEKSLKTESREYDAFMLQNRLGEFVFIQEKKVNRIRKEMGGGILIPMQDFEIFVEYMKETVDYIKKIKNGGFEYIQQ